MRVGVHEAIHGVGLGPSTMNSGVRIAAVLCGTFGNQHHSGFHFFWICFQFFGAQSQESAPPDWYSITRVSKKLRSFFKSIISLIHGNGFSSLG